MASSTAPWCVFFIINIIIILTDHEAVPHMATNEDVYDGYYIPKGTVVIGSAWLE
jgi:hypothetical protein